MHWNTEFNKHCAGRERNHAQLVHAGKEADHKTCAYFSPQCAVATEIDIDFFIDTSTLAYSLLTDLEKSEGITSIESDVNRPFDAGKLRSNDTPYGDIRQPSGPMTPEEASTMRALEKWLA